MRRHLTRHVLQFPPPVRDPRVQVLALATVLGGATLIAGGPAPNTLARALPHNLLIAWAIGLLVSGVGFMLAAVWRDIVTGVFIEGYACLVAFLAMTAYSAGVIAVVGHEAFVQPVFTAFAYGVGCLARLIGILLQLRRAHAAVRVQVEHAEEGRPAP